MYAYYVELPRILISGKKILFNPPVEFLEILHFFVLAHSAHFVTICANIHTYNLART